MKILLVFLFFSTEIFCSYFSLGTQYFLDKKYELAEYWLKKSYLLEEDKNDKDILFLLGNVYYLNKKYTLAEKTFRLLLKNYLLDKQTENFAKYMIAECNIYLGEFEEAIEFCDKIDIQNFEKTLLPYLYYTKIFGLFKTGKYNSVLTNISLLNSYLKETNFLLEKEIIDQINYILAESWYAKGNYKNAVENFKKVLSENGDKELSVYAKLRLASIYEEQKNYQQAETILKNINLEYIPSDEIKFLVRHNIAKLFVKQNRFKDAIEIYTQLLKEVPNNTESLMFELAYCYFRTHNYDKAISILLQLKDKNLEKEIHLNVLYLLGLAYYNNENYTASIKTLELLKNQFGSKNKWYDDVCYIIGLSYFNLNEYKKTIKVLSELSTKKSSIYYISSRIYIAKAYKELKEYELAKNMLIKLLENRRLDTEIKALVMYELAECYKISAEYQTALQYYNQILSSKVSAKLQYLSKFSLAEINFNLSHYLEAEQILNDLLNTKNLNKEIMIKSKLLYVKLKYVTEDYESVEKLVLELANEVTDNEEKKYLLSLLTNVYIKTNNFEKAVKNINKLLSFIQNDEEKFLLNLRLLRLYLSSNKCQDMYEKILLLQKEYIFSEQKCILLYFLAKYYQSLQQEKDVASTLAELKIFLPQDFKFYTKNEVLDLLNLCSIYNLDVLIYFSEHIITSLKLFSDDEKIEILKKSVEHLMTNKNFSSVMRIATLIKKISSDVDTVVYSEFLIGKVYELTDKKNLAENVYKSIIERYPDSQYTPKVCVSLINYYCEKEDKKQADFYKELLLSKYSVSDETCEYLYNESLKFVKENKFEDAIKNLSLAVKSKNRDIAVKSQKLLADCYYNLGKYKEAAVEYLQIVYLFPEKTDFCAEAQYMVGVCAEKLNLYDEAKKAYKKLKSNYPGTLWAEESELRLRQIR